MTPCSLREWMGACTMPEINPPEDPVEFLRSLSTLFPDCSEPLEALTVDELIAEKILTLNQDGDYHAGQ